METAWIQVFVLSLSECVAPAGKTVCQEQAFELQFATQADCEFALEQFVALKSESEKVIIDPARASCTATARQTSVFASIDAINKAYGKRGEWRAPEPEAGPAPDTERSPHDDRLASLPPCGDADGVAPCRIGDIIIEEATGDPVEVWRRN